MSAKFYTLLTDIGAAKLASAAALGVPLKITQMAVGDGGGVLPTPNAQQTKLVAEKRRADLNMLYIDPQNSSQIIAEQVIPETEGGWWIREVGLFDETGALIAVGNCPESYKPQLAEGSGRTQTVRMVMITSSTDNITLKIDPAVVLATRKYVDDKVLELKVYVDDLMAKHIAANDPHTQYAPKASPTFTGTPKAPTAAAGNNSTQLANTAFVQAAIAALVDSSPGALDTLNELAKALGNDPNFATTMTNALAGKMDKSANGADIADISAFLNNLGLGAGSALPVGVPVPWPLAAAPAGWLKCNGAAFTAAQYPKLALAYPALKLPDLRGEFIRGWDDGRGVDSSRGILSAQTDAIRNITGTFGHLMYETIDAASENATTSSGVFRRLKGTDPVGYITSNYSNSGTFSSVSKTDNLQDGTMFDASRVVPTANENRPRNIAFNYIVRAA
ncbi:phage tail protein [Enterobacter roggenkampii]|nr:phage tail protein [Enterobacter roggenkampii]